MLTTPVALVVFNRPHLTEQTLAAIREAAPQQLYVIADGPRADRPEDAELCAATRALLDAVDWPCEVHRRFAPENLGLEANVELGLDWLFSQVESAIVLEDDCHPDPSFFRYADELLAHHRDDPRIWQVSGSGMGVPERLFGGDSYAYTAWASVWGWATWADRWQRHRAIFTRDHAPSEAPVRTVAPTQQPGHLVTRSGEQHFADAARSDDTITHGWDKHWWITMLTLGGLAISPSRNLVENVGWGADATHGAAEGKRDHGAAAMDFPLRHPAQVAVNVEVERELELVLSRVGGRFARVARRMVRSPRLRRAARTAVNSRPAMAVQRFVSRSRDRVSR
ncbi:MULTISPECIES: glycosyltransferase family 2 protein [unclassified Nocardioides]|uniref:glycosyltransferase family 2 protein n=1 Tax=unclassified Nocardioides TaxID=2615069 RepID=UPI000A84F8B4|nr:MULTISPECIES: glycosyltransferase family 2 protein [unclassified Nocardioides]